MLFIRYNNDLHGRVARINFFYDFYESHLKYAKENFCKTETMGTKCSGLMKYVKIELFSQKLHNTFEDGKHVLESQHVLKVNAPSH